MRGGPLVIIGDSLLDVDIIGTAQRLSPDGPIPVVDCREERHRAGGAGLAAVLAAGLTTSGVILVTALGGDPMGERLRSILEGQVTILPLPLRGSTSAKIRVRAAGQSLVRLDSGDGRAGAGPAGAPVARALETAGAVLVSDYGRGMAAHPGIAGLLRCLRKDIPVVWDPHPAGPPPGAGVRLVTPNRAEARAFAAALGGEPEPPAAASIAQAAQDASRLAAAWRTAVALTMGEDGALLSVGDPAPMVAPAAPLDSVPADTCGAGDCFAVAAALALGGGALLTEAVTEAVRRASAFVSAGGAATAPGITIPRPPAGPGPATDPPLLQPPSATAWDLVSRVRARGGKVVATGGCFDLLHAGHVSLLREARRLGDCLIVCLNSDSSARALKGPQRPLVTELDRMRVLSALESVDGVVVFDEPTPSRLLERLRPDVWVKGGDYGGAELAEAAVIRRHGGQVVLLPYVDHHSTSAIVAAVQRTPAAPGALAGGHR